MNNNEKLVAGEWVEVRSREEILATLDEQGEFANLPFMPEMLEFCGRRFQVSKRAHKTCDTVNVTGGRRLANGIHLDLRCDGQAYGGCQAAWRAASSASERYSSSRRPGTSSSIVSPVRTSPSGPPTAASGAT